MVIPLRPLAYDKSCQMCNERKLTSVVQDEPQYQNSAHPEHLESLLPSGGRQRQKSHRFPFSDGKIAVTRVSVDKTRVPGGIDCVAVTFCLASSCGSSEIMDGSTDLLAMMMTANCYGISARLAEGSA